MESQSQFEVRQRREFAIKSALDAHRSAGEPVDAKRLVEDAKVIEAYLRGDDGDKAE